MKRSFGTGLNVRKQIDSIEKQHREMLKQKVISQKLSMRGNRMRTMSSESDYKQSLYKLKYDKTKSLTNYNYDQVQDMEKREQELLERLKHTQQKVMETEAKLESKISNGQQAEQNKTKSKSFYKLKVPKDQIDEDDEEAEERG